MLTARGDDVDSVVGLELVQTTIWPNRPILAYWWRGFAQFCEEQSIPTANERSGQIALDDIVMHPGSRPYVGNSPISMTSTEFSVLDIFLREAGNIVTKANPVRAGAWPKIEPL